VELLAIIGAGGLAREVLDIVDAQNAVAPRYELIGWLVEPPYGAPGTVVCGRPILGDVDWLAGRAAGQAVICAVGDPALRRRLVDRASGLGARFVNAVHPRALCGSRVTTGAGVMIGAGAVLTCDIRLGNHVLINPGCTVSHDAVLGDFASLAVGVHVAGGVTVGAGALLGAGANVIPRIRVGAWSRVGAGSAVIADVPADSTVVGVPGRVVRQRAPGWHLAGPRGA
jgi:sugar O-acyltransferase (sialic acid O-acetyltransferase NeuD family)